MGFTSKRAVLVKANEPVEIWDRPMGEGRHIHGAIQVARRHQPRCR